ncbi:unnamed protein product [Rangifer tarandus platyrhynchus]|uniref:Uncharacterized protein n=1 Tax=Rangifer tarandus platyrhynchus TaxID=3082113 RepID=A0ABN8ZFS2_RANTA|nr:unnamed protein product [Rangifer tarandus platyrhynchus]
MSACPLSHLGDEQSDLPQTACPYPRARALSDKVKACVFGDSEAAEELGRALDEKQKGFAVGWNRGGKTIPGHRAAAAGAVCPGEGRLPARGVHSLQPHARGLSAHLGTVATWVICEPM